MRSPVLCSKYGPVTVGWDGKRIHVNPSRCDGEVPLRELALQVPIRAADRRLLYLLGIPRGHVATYKTYAEVLGTTPRHVGMLMARNPFPVLLPCHRVVKSDISLGGYTGGGVEVKKALLEYEGALCDGVPCRQAKPEIPDDIEEALFKSLGFKIYLESSEWGQCQLR